jgi:hypothetical protein
MLADIVGLVQWSDVLSNHALRERLTFNCSRHKAGCQLFLLIFKLTVVAPESEPTRTRIETHLVLYDFLNSLATSTSCSQTRIQGTKNIIFWPVVKLNATQ